MVREAKKRQANLNRLTAKPQATKNIELNKIAQSAHP